MRVLLASLVLSLAACSSGLDIITDCQDTNGIHPICGLQNPEDLALLADDRTVIVSQFGGMDGTRPGNLGLFDALTEKLRVAYRPEAEQKPTPGWGDEACEGSPPEGFAPHGIDLATRPDGRQQLLVVNHGGRESVEFFEVMGVGDAARIEWRGCSAPLDGAFFNDVVSLPDGGFLVTQMMKRDSQTSQLLLAMLGGMDTGWVYEWQPGRGFSVLPGSDGPFPNGIELSADAKDVYVNMYFGDEVRRISRETGEILAVGQVKQPDNSSWGKDGRLLVASHVAGFTEHMPCYELPAGSACPFGFEIIAFDPKTMEREVVFENAGPPMGAATIALDLGSAMLLGSFAGDRMIRVPR